MSSQAASETTPPPAPTADAEVSFITGIDAGGTAASTNFWTYENSVNPASYPVETAHKWGAGVAGTSGGTIAYGFTSSAQWSVSEKAAINEALALWSAIANVRFVETSPQSSDILFYRASPGQGTECATGYAPVPGGLATIDAATAVIDTSAPGWQALASFTVAGGYGIDTLLRETGQLLGLGQGGSYNGAADPATQQIGPWDTRQWTVMSAINPFPDADGVGRYVSQYALQGTQWGRSADGYQREPTGLMPLDILAMQRLYGKPVATPLSGGQTFGFHCNVDPSIAAFFDFTVNVDPILTLWDAGGGNTLDVSGFVTGSTVDLMPGTFSSVDGMVNNIGIADGVSIDTAIGGPGGDLFTVNAEADRIVGGGGSDTVRFTAAAQTYTVSDAGARIAFGGVVDTLAGIGAVLLSGGADTVSLADPNGLWWIGPGEAELATSGFLASVPGGAAMVLLQGGNDTVALIAGTLAAAGSGDVIFLGAGAASVTLTSKDTVVGGTGAATVQGGAADGSVVFDAAGALDYAGGTGDATVVAVHATVSGGGGASLVWGGVDGAADDTLLYAGGSGRATVGASGGAQTIYGGAGGGLFIGAAGPGAFIDANGGSATIFAQGWQDRVVLDNAALDVVIANSRSATVDASSARGPVAIYCGSGSDCVVGGSGDSTVQGGAGEATLAAGTGAMLLEIVAGTGGADTIAGWNAHRDSADLVGYARGTQSVVAVAGGFEVSLPDRTTLLFQHVAAPPTFRFF